MIIYVLDTLDPTIDTVPHSDVILMRGYLGGYPSKDFSEEAAFFRWATTRKLVPSLLGDPEEEYFYDPHVVVLLTEHALLFDDLVEFVLPRIESQSERITAAMVCAAVMNLRAMKRAARVRLNEWSSTFDEREFHDSVMRELAQFTYQAGTVRDHCNYQSEESA